MMPGGGPHTRLYTYENATMDHRFHLLDQPEIAAWSRQTMNSQKRAHIECLLDTISRRAAITGNISLLLR
jgi:hypothetical protein